ncbi:piggyBac transposable element-derived protein 3-like [Sitophilus oryzae]|uniref:PiggyBac transposable element-derived protein 3-like n=1 Tax=Sitophilus oryzae TaxID=7048 RepID=A0A6J2Y4P1_SITOR|nr:piggyBac transposable element-derived protein 3-like [Sitophilus oryzae]
MSDYDVRFARGFSLHETLAMLEEDEVNADSIMLLPPNNACGNITDEDSGAEDQLDINNLPSSMNESQVEVNIQVTEEWSSEDELPLSDLQYKAKHNPAQKSKLQDKKKKIYQFMREDLLADDYVFPEDITVVKICCLQQNFSNIFSMMKPGQLDIQVFPEEECRYWKNSRDAHILVSEAISRDNMHLDQNDKFSELHPFFNRLNNFFLEKAPLEENRSIDEAMVPYNGRHGCKQFNHNKPIRYGFTLWVGTTRLGYTNWFEPYQGASTYVNLDYKDLGVGASVVLSYADRIRERWLEHKFHFFFDNFFSSPSLLEALLEKGIVSTGTMRENRLPMSPLNSSATMKKENRGVFDYTKMSDQNIIFVKWNDNNIVTFGS